MKNILLQILKTILFYILGFIFLYPLAPLSLILGTAPMFLYITQVLIMGVFCFLLGYLLNRYRRSAAGDTATHVRASKRHDFIIQAFTVCLIFTFTVYKEVNQIYYLNRNLFGFFRFICFGNENLAGILYTGPVLNLPYFIQIFIGWIFFKVGIATQRRINVTDRKKTWKSRQ